MTSLTLDPGASHRGAALGAATASVAGRTLRKFARTPQLIVVGAIQGAMFLLIFRYVFGGAINAHGLPYVDFLVPGFVTTGLLFSGTAAAVGIAEDVEGGLFDRLRSLPIPRASVLAGRGLADTAMLAWGTVVTVAIGFAIGFRAHAGVPSALAALGLCLLFGFAFVWMFMAIGLIAGNAQAAQAMALVVFPLTFVSSAYVPVSTMPGWLQPIARSQPLTSMVNSVRALTQGHAATAMIGHSTTYEVAVSLAWCGVIVAVFVPLAVRRYQKG